MFIGLIGAIVEAVTNTTSFIIFGRLTAKFAEVSFSTVCSNQRHNFSVNGTSNNRCLLSMDHNISDDVHMDRLKIFFKWLTSSVFILIVYFRLCNEYISTKSMIPDSFISENDRIYMVTMIHWLLSK